MPHNVILTIQHQQNSPQEAPEAIVVPATDEQRHDLGRGAIGQAWMTWTPSEVSYRTIKFMPPQPITEDTWRALLQSYRLAIRIADNHEIKSLSVPLPEQAGLGSLEKEQAMDLQNQIQQQCHEFNHLEQINFVAREEREAALYTDMSTGTRSDDQA